MTESCAEKDNDRPGNDIEYVLNVPTWEQCSKLCSQNNECTFWTWVDDTYTLNTAIIHKCHLKNGNPRVVSVTGLVSGASGCKAGKNISCCHVALHGHANK